MLNLHRKLQHSVTALHPEFDVKLIKLERYRGAYALMTLIAELLMIIYTIYFLITEIKEMKKMGFRNYIYVSR